MTKLNYKIITLLVGVISSLGIYATAQASFSVPLVATSTASNIAFPQWGGTVQYPALDAPYFVGTSTTPSIFTNASTTNLSAGTFCLTGDTCRTTWPTGGSGTVTQVNTTFPILGGPITNTGTLTFGGLSTSTPAVSGNIPYFSGVNTFANLSTTTASCSGSASCSPFVVFGSTPVVITATGGSGSVYPFTPQTYGVSTSTTFGFLNGLLVTASSTFTNALRLSSLNDGTLNVSNSLVYSTATSAATVSSPLTGSFTCPQSGCSIGIQAASAGQNGYLSSTDYSLLHTATTTFTSPLVYTLSTNAVTCPTCTTGGVTSVTASAPIFSSGGATPNITWAGLATTSQPSAGNLLESDGKAGVFGVATSTLSASSPLTGSFTQIGSGGSLGIQAASAGQNGYLSSNDYSLLHSATTTFSSPLVYTLSTNAVTCPSCSTFAYPFTLATNYAATSQATTGVPWFQNGFQSSTTAQIAYASTTNISATTICLTGDTCRTTWPTGGGGGAYPFPVTTPATGNATSTLTQFNGGLTAYASSTIGNATQAGGLTINGGATTTGNLQVGTGSATAFMVDPTTGFVGVGTSSPYAQLSVAGQAVAGYFTATSTTQASTFPYASTTALSATSLCFSSDCRTSWMSVGVPYVFPLALNATSTTVGFNNGLFTQASSTFQGSTTFTGNVGFTIASSTLQPSTWNVNWASSTIQRFLLTQATNIVINATSSNPLDGGKYILKLCQDGTGSRAVTFITPGQLRWSMGTTTVDSGANRCTWLGMIYDSYYSNYTVIAATSSLAQ